MYIMYMKNKTKMKDSYKILATTLIFLLYSMAFGILYRFNTCSEGGIFGLMCDCKGIRVQISAQRHPDGMQEIACFGLIQDN